MGWMHDTLQYFARDHAQRRWHHADITFGLTYAHAEAFVLPLSHDEVVHLKKALVAKLPADAALAAIHRDRAHRQHGGVLNLRQALRITALDHVRAGGRAAGEHAKDGESSDDSFHGDGPRVL
eukprot:gene49565-biopygen34757